MYSSTFRQAISNEYLVAKIGVDTAGSGILHPSIRLRSSIHPPENVLLQVWEIKWWST